MHQRKSTSTRPAAGRQSTLSFHTKVTKHVPRSTKDAVLPPAVLVKKQELAEQALEPVDKLIEPKKAAKHDDDKEMEEAEEPEPKSVSELLAEKVTRAQVEAYGQSIEIKRGKAAHQEHLTLSEKILCYFDVNSRYGPCVGITRHRRWQRADRLGLKPPIEVLAVLLWEESKGDDAAKAVERACVDILLNPRPPVHPQLAEATEVS